MPKQVDHGQRRDEMAEALWRIAAYEGLEAVSLSRVAEEAGVSKGRVQHYFPSRDALLAYTATHLVARVDARMAARVGAAPDSLAGVRVALLEVMPLDDDSTIDTRVGFAFLIRSLGDTALRELYRQRLDQFVDSMTGLLTAARDEGRVVADCDPRREATVLFALANGLKESLLAGAQTAAEATAVIDDALARLSTVSARSASSADRSDARRRPGSGR